MATTTLPDKEVLELAQAMAGNWKRMQSFMWFRESEIEDSDNWAIIYMHNRDSGLLDQSNVYIGVVEVKPKSSELVSTEEREQLRPFLSLIRNPDRLYARTMTGDFFDCADHAAMAFLIWRRMGRNNEATSASWRRLMENPPADSS